MKLEEAKKKLNYYKQLLIAIDETETPNDFAKAIETVLQALDNSISKEKLKEIIDKCIPIKENIITKQLEYTPNANANSYLTQQILELLEDK